MAIWTVYFARRQAREQSEMNGRHWYVKKDHARFWMIAFSVLGMAVLSGLLFFVGAAQK
jgi:hypothetical protein